MITANDIHENMTADQVVRYVNMSGDPDGLLPNMVRAMEIYAAFQTKRVRYKAIEVVQEIDPGPATPLIVEEIQRIN